LRGLGLLAFCAMGAVAFDFVLKPHRPPAPPKTASLTPTSPKRADPPPLPKWLDDLRAAKAVAKAEHKDILLEFARPVAESAPVIAATHSKTLLDSDLFLNRAGAAFVLLRLTVSPEMPDRTVARVTHLLARMAVTRFPTFVLLDSQGVPYARSELITQRVSEYRREFDRLRQIHVRRDRELTLAAVTTGIECARHLDAVLKIVGPLADTEYADLELRVTELDPKNKAGLRAKYEAAVVHRKIDRAIQAEVSPLMDRREYQAALARLDLLMAGAKPSRDQLQRLLAFKGQAYCGLNDRQRSAKVLDQAIALDPQSESARRARDVKQQLQKLR
jgi:hypothetical protein